MMKTLFIKLYNTISFDSMVAVSLYLIWFCKAYKFY